MRTKFFQQLNCRQTDSRGPMCVLVVLLTALSLVQGVSSTYAQAPGDTFVHLFEWKWTDIAEECEQFLGPNGFKAIQVSPPNEHAVVTDPAYPWWQRYQPVSYQIESRSGTRAEFADMVSRCHAVGVDIYVDAIINHMSRVYPEPRVGYAGTPFYNYTYPTSGTSGPDYTYTDFHHCGTINGDEIDDILSYQSREQIQTCELANLADLDTGSEAVRNKIAGYLNDLLSLGVAGFRIDASKHMAAGDINAILNKLSNTNYGTPPYIFQEVIGNDSEPVKIYEYYDSTRGYANGDVTEFGYGSSLASTFRSGQLAWFNGANQFGEGWGLIPAEHAVVFTDNHDNQRGHGGGGNVVTHEDGALYSLANVFMLAWPYGYPKVMSSYEFTEDWEGPPSDGSGNTNDIYTGDTPDFTGWIAEHRWQPIVGMVKFRKAAGAEPLANWWDNGNNQIAFGRGDRGFVAINHEKGDLLQTLQTGLPAGRYCNALDGNLDSGNCTGSSITVGSDGNAVFYVEPGKAVAIHVDAKASAGGSEPVAANFNVEVPDDGRPVFVVGNVSELGNWNPASAVPLTSGNGTNWSGTVSLLASTQVEYKYIKKNGDVEWESGSNRVFITPDSGTETRRDTWKANVIPTTFRVNATTILGEGIFVVGSISELGSWNLSNAIRLSADNYPIWEITIDLPPNTAFEYKFTKGPYDGTPTEWESGSNRQFSTPASGTAIAGDDPDVWQSGGASNPYNKDIYLRGSMNGWGTADTMTFSNDAFTIVLSLNAAHYEFKIADDSWTPETNFGGATANETVVIGTPHTLARNADLLGDSQNLHIDIPAAETYRFTMNVSGSTTAPELTVEAAPMAVIHYWRSAGDYDGWGLHLWNHNPPPNALAASVFVGLDWDNPRMFEGEDSFGKYSMLELNDPSGTFGFIIHKGAEKDCGQNDHFLTPDTDGFEVWMIQGDATHYYSEAEALAALGIVGDLAQAKARWISRDSIAWNLDNVSGYTPYLYYSPTGLTVSSGQITGGTKIPLTFNGTIGSGTANDQKLAYLSYLSGWDRIDTSSLSRADLETYLTGALAIGIKNSEGDLVDATSIQLAGVLDDLYTYPGDDLGLTFNGTVPTLKLWAPTAQSVNVHVYQNSTGGMEVPGSPVAMTKLMNGSEWTGVWTVTGTADWYGKFYLYEVDVFSHWTGNINNNMVTDPYSVSLSENSERSQIVDLADAALKPAGWDSLQKPDFDVPEDMSVYELHVRDFSITDTTVSPAYQGKFKAFTESSSNSMQHLKALQEAGLTHIHLLPSFDISTVDEDPGAQINLDNTVGQLCTKLGTEAVSTLGSYCNPSHPAYSQTIRTAMQEAVAAHADTEVPQRLTGATRQFDGFNWGYDPFHYSVPEGSYATDADGTARILEFREMVKALNDTGLRVVMDVVYNHTFECRDEAESVFDKIVPGYYYRLDDNGDIQRSSCCPDTASEHKMMEKLLIDSVLLWTTQYKVDGFRFDLMGHHAKTNMQNLRTALDGLTVGNDCVDGADIYVYGEGWHFGSLPPLGIENANQWNLAGTGIGTFNDRIRNGLGHGDNSGFIDGNFGELDRVRMGLAGNLRNVSFTNVDTGGTYTLDPQENVNYITAHDNETLWDQLVIRHSDEDAVTIARRQNLGISVIALAQGISFFHAGSDMLRSKSGDRDSYDSGDWFNKLDFAYQNNNFAVGLPGAWRNSEGNWNQLRPLLTNPSFRPSQDVIVKSVAHLCEMLDIRKSSKLFRLETASEIQDRVQFLNAETSQIPGVIAMTISDEIGGNLDPKCKLIVVVFNATNDHITFSHDNLKYIDLQLHPVLQNSTDNVVKLSTFDSDTGTITVPALTTAVFQDAEQVIPEPTTTPSTVIPEPGTCFLLSIGLLGLALKMKKWKTRR